MFDYLTGVASSVSKSSTQKVLGDCPQVTALREKFLTPVICQNRNGNLENTKPHGLNESVKFWEVLLLNSVV